MTQCTTHTGDDDDTHCSHCQRTKGWDCDTCGERKLKRHTKHTCETHPTLGLDVCLDCSIFYRAESRRTEKGFCTHPECSGKKPIQSVMSWRMRRGNMNSELLPFCSEHIEWANEQRRKDVVV